MEIYGRVRRAVLVEGKSERVVAQEFGIARDTVRKMLRYSVPPGYRREQPVERPKLGPWIGVIDAILEKDKNNPVKQRHTSERIFSTFTPPLIPAAGITAFTILWRLDKVRPSLHESKKRTLRGGTRAAKSDRGSLYFSWRLNGFPLHLSDFQFRVGHQKMPDYGLKGFCVRSYC